MHSHSSTVCDGARKEVLSLFQLTKETEALSGPASGSWSHREKVAGPRLEPSHVAQKASPGTVSLVPLGSLIPSQRVANGAGGEQSMGPD